MLGLIDETPDLVERLVDFYASQVVAFYDPEPRRFYVVRGAAGGALEGTGIGGARREPHLLSRADARAPGRVPPARSPDPISSSDDGDRALALQCLLEGEATLVMVRVALPRPPGGG